MALSPFLKGLFGDGKALVDPPGLIDAEDLRESRAILELEEAKVRAEFPGHAPQLNLAAAMWGAETFQRICQLAVFRTTTTEMVTAALAEICPAGPAAERHYAVDLTWRFLPDLFRFAQAASKDDPLVKAMLAAAGEWPLSSVGIADVQVVTLSGVLDHPGLCRVYIDRVMLRRDTARLVEPRVLQGVLAAVGMHTSLIADWKRQWPDTILGQLAEAPLGVRET